MPAAVWRPRGAPIPGKDRRASLETVPFRRERSTSQNATPVDARARGCRNSRYTRAERLPFQPKKAAPEPKQDGDCQRQVEAHGADGSYAVHAFIPRAPEWTPCRSDTLPPAARRTSPTAGSTMRDRANDGIGFSIEPRFGSNLPPSNTPPLLSTGASAQCGSYRTRRGTARVLAARL